MISTLLDGLLHSMTECKEHSAACLASTTSSRFGPFLARALDLWISGSLPCTCDCSPEASYQLTTCEKQVGTLQTEKEVSHIPMVYTSIIALMKRNSSLYWQLFSPMIYICTMTDRGCCVEATAPPSWHSVPVINNGS
jgi:hypothetical protein